MAGNGHAPFGQTPSEKDPNRAHPAGDLPHPAAGAEPLHLATVIDLCSTRLVGYEIADRMRT